MNNFIIKVLNKIATIIIKFAKLITNIVLIIFLPFIDTLTPIIRKIINYLNKNFKIDIDFVIKILDKCEQVLNISIILYYLLLLTLEMALTINILNGVIPNYDFISLFILTMFTVLITIYLVNIINKKKKSKKTNIITYIQILYLLPLITAYWIASIEGHDIILKNINADQWCNIFNSIIIYVSGCIIGFSNYLKTEK